MAENEIECVRNKEPSRIIVLEAAVLFEAGWEDAVGEVWVVSLDRDQAIQRAGSRDGTHKAAVQKRINAQMGNEERAERAHVIIDNSGDVADLLTQLDIQWQRIVRMMPQEAS